MLSQHCSQSTSLLVFSFQTLFLASFKWSNCTTNTSHINSPELLSIVSFVIQNFWCWQSQYETLCAFGFMPCFPLHNDCGFINWGDKCPVCIKKYNELFNLISLTWIFILVSMIIFLAKIGDIVQIFVLEIRTKIGCFNFVDCHVWWLYWFLS